jgi:hypothetical protein
VTRHHEVNNDLAVEQPQHTGRHFDNAGKGGWITDRSNAFTVPPVSAEVLGSLKCPRQ